MIGTVLIFTYMCICVYIYIYIYIYRAVSEEFHTGRGDSQSPRPVSFSRLLRHAENTLALFFCYARHHRALLCLTPQGYPPNWGKWPRYIEYIYIYIYIYMYIYVYSYLNFYISLYLHLYQRTFTCKGCQIMIAPPLPTCQANTVIARSVMVTLSESTSNSSSLQVSTCVLLC